jgi:quercetin dioxygenase-like cupin family protein
LTNPIADPTSLLELAAYQPDSVVSKVLARNDGGVVTLFAFAEGQGLTEHSTPHEAILLILEGEVLVTIGGREHTVGSGEILHLPPSIPHALEGRGPFKMLLTILKKPKAS